MSSAKVYCVLKKAFLCVLAEKRKKIITTKYQSARILWNKYFFLKYYARSLNWWSGQVRTAIIEDTLYISYKL